MKYNRNMAAMYMESSNLYIKANILSLPTCCVIQPPQGTQFEVMIGRTAFIDRLLAEVYR